MNEITVLRLGREHLSGVAELERLCFPSPWSEQALELLLRQDEAIGFVAVQNGAVLAYGGMLLTPFDAQIINIAVHPDARRNGLGKQILATLLEEASARVPESVTLEVRVSNTAAIALYEQYGFRTVGKRKSFYTLPTEDALVMERKLK